MKEIGGREKSWRDFDHQWIIIDWLVCDDREKGKSAPQELYFDGWRKKKKKTRKQMSLFS